MRLTKAIKENMVAAIMRDVPDNREEIFAELKPKVEQFFIDILPACVALAYAEYPKYLETRRVSVWSNTNGSRWSNGDSYGFNDAIEVPDYTYEYDELIRKEAWFVEFMLRIDSTTQQIYKASKEATAALDSVTTANRLRDLYPDLAKYLPSDVSGTALTVPQTLPDLHTAGWPKERSNEAREQVPESAEAEA